MLDRQQWFEVRPPWPSRVQTGDELLNLMAMPNANWVVLLNRIAEVEESRVMIEAIEQGPPQVRAALLEPLARRRENAGHAVVAKYLRDTNPRVRAEAAHALEHHGDGSWAGAILKAAQVEDVPEVLELQIRALAVRNEDELPKISAWLAKLAASGETEHLRYAAAETVARLSGHAHPSRHFRGLAGGRC